MDRYESDTLPLCNHPENDADETIVKNAKRPNNPGGYIDKADIKHGVVYNHVVTIDDEGDDNKGEAQNKNNVLIPIGEVNDENASLEESATPKHGGDQDSSDNKCKLKGLCTVFSVFSWICMIALAVGWLIYWRLIRVAVKEEHHGLENNFTNFMRSDLAKNLAIGIGITLFVFGCVGCVVDRFSERCGFTKRRRQADLQAKILRTRGLFII